MEIQVDPTGKIFLAYKLFLVPKNYEKNDKIPYKDVIQKLQYVYNQDTNQ